MKDLLYVEMLRQKKNVSSLSLLLGCIEFTTFIMRPTATDDPVARRCQSVSVSVTRLRYAKTAKRIDVLIRMEMGTQSTHTESNGDPDPPIART